MSFVHTVEHYPVLKRKEILIQFEDIHSGIKQSQKDKHYMILFIFLHIIVKDIRRVVVRGLLGRKLEIND